MRPPAPRSCGKPLRATPIAPTSPPALLASASSRPPPRTTRPRRWRSCCARSPRPGADRRLVSPDRVLARRVVQRLEAWGIRVDDSAGRPFGKTAPGAFLDLVIEAAAANFAPAELMALLKHPLCRLGLEPAHVRRAARALEIAAFRTAYLGEGLDGVAAALARAERAGGARDETQRCAACGRGLARRERPRRAAAQRVRPLVAARARRAEALHDLAAAHAAAAEAPPLRGNRAPLAGRGRETAAALFEALGDPNTRAAAARDRLRRFLPQPVAREAVRSRLPAHPRLFVWGPFEARLQQPDVLVLGSLNEGPGRRRPTRALAQPADAPGARLAGAGGRGRAVGARLRLAVRRRAGLPDARREAGRRADRPSRWLMRLKALLGGLGLADALVPEQPWLAWARAHDAARRVPPIAAPAPRPPLELRPRKLSVSKVETWIRTLRHLRGIDPGTGAAARARRASERRPEGQHRARGAVAVRAFSRRAALRPGSRADRDRAAILWTTPVTPGSRRSGCRGSSGSPAGSPRRSRGGASVPRSSRGRRQARDRGPGGASSPPAPTASTSATRGSSSPTTRRARSPGQPSSRRPRASAPARGGDRGCGRASQRRRGTRPRLRYIRASVPSGRRGAHAQVGDGSAGRCRARRPDEAPRYDDPVTPYVACVVPASTIASTTTPISRASRNGRPSRREEAEE